MAVEVIRGAQTAPYLADRGDVITLVAGASLITTTPFSLTTRTPQDYGITLQIDGLIDNRNAPPPNPVVEGAAIFLGSRPTGPAALDTHNIVRIGATGHVISQNGIAVFVQGGGSTILNRGLVEGYGGLFASGNGQTIRNDGTVNFGVQGFGLSGQSSGPMSSIINTGTLRHVAAFDDPTRSDWAMINNVNNVRVLNTGLIEATNGIISFGSDVGVRNTGTITTVDTAVLVGGGDNCNFVNTGTITGTGAVADATVYFSGSYPSLSLLNTGRITSASNAVGSGPTRVVNTGEIVAAKVGIADWSDQSLTLTNSGHITGGSAGVTSYSDGGMNASVIINSGTISGQIGTGPAGISVRLEGNIGKIINSGTLIGNVEMNCMVNQLTNSGTIIGDVIGGYGALGYIATGWAA